MKIGINNYFKEKHLARITVRPTELIQAVKKEFSKKIPGDKPGTFLVPVGPSTVKGLLVTLKEGDRGEWVFERRPGVSDDMPMKRVLAPEGAVPDEFTSVSIVIYSKETLGKDQSDSETDYELVSIITGNGEQQPIHPDTLDRNYFGLPGGTEMDITPEEFIALRRRSILFWHNKAII